MGGTPNQEQPVDGARADVQQAQYNPSWLHETGSPTIRGERLDYARRVFDEMRRELPGIDKSLGDTPVKLSLGNPEGMGWSETYTVGNTDMPTNPEAMRIELQKGQRYLDPLTRHDSGQRGKLKELFAAETTHQLADVINGVPFDEKIFNWKRELLDNIDSLPNDHRIKRELRRRYDRTREELLKKRPDGNIGSNWESFENAKRGPMGDWLLFERVFPELMNTEDDRRYMRQGGGFGESQMNIINKVKSYLTGR